MLELNHISKNYRDKRQVVEVIRNLGLSVKNQEFVALVGPSGCGKTTLLRIVAGLIPPTCGEILANGRRIAGPGQDRGFVFQQLALFPWLTVEKNIRFGLGLQRMADTQKTEMVAHYLNVTGLTDFADFYPKQLSGGMQQRVAIARTLANNPEILLMDEPFGSLDSQTRSQMQEFLLALWEKEQKTILFVTHDVGEAVFLADTVYVTTKRPMELKKKFPVPFNRPRTHALKRSKEFFELENRISQELEH